MLSHLHNAEYQLAAAGMTGNLQHILAFLVSAPERGFFPFCFVSKSGRAYFMGGSLQVTKSEK